MELDENIRDLSYQEIFRLSRNSFKFFNQVIFPYSILDYKKTPHTNKWADIVQNNQNSAILSARLHLKSTTIYSFLMWLLWCYPEKSWEILYLSFKKPMAEYHTKKIKEHIKRNPFFKNIIDLTPAESLLKYQTLNGNKFVVEPEGILSFKRGRHPDIAVCDDILQDPSQELNLTIINKITRIFFEEVLNIPKKEGKLILIGTAQHPDDLFFQIKRRTDKKEMDFNWSEWKAILNEKKKEVLWKEQFPYEWLIKKRIIGEKAFNKEFMCSPVHSEEAYFKREEIMPLIDINLKNWRFNDDKVSDVLAGLDIGKKAHPSHFAVFKKYKNKYVMIYEEFFVNVDYIDQVNKIKRLIETLKIDKIKFDDTRGEFVSFMEQGIIDKKIWIPINFTEKSKGTMASNFGTIVSLSNHKKEGYEIKLINNDKMIRSILSVNNSLKALETPEGHGDAFWSIAMALYEGEPRVPLIFDFGDKFRRRFQKTGKAFLELKK